MYAKYEGAIILTSTTTIKSIAQTRLYFYNITHINHVRYG
jgi:hypothetical protein